MMNISRRRLCTILVVLSVSACGTDNSSVNEPKIEYLPYYDIPGCSDALSLVEKTLQKVNVQYDISRLTATRDSIPDFTFNSLVKFSYWGEDKEAIDPLINRYLFDCVPAGRIQVISKEFDEQFIIRTIQRSPGKFDPSKKKYFIEISGNTVSIYF